MMRRIFILFVSLALIIPALAQSRYTLLSMHKIKNEKRHRVMKIKPGKQFVKVIFADSSIYLNNVFSANDTSLFAEHISDTIAIPLKNIRFIKKMTGGVEKIGSVLLGSGIVGIAVVVPFYYEFSTTDNAVRSLIVTTSLFAASVPFIVIGSSATRFKMSKWKIDAVVQPGNKVRSS
jgi:hypothetical protein